MNKNDKLSHLDLNDQKISIPLEDLQISSQHEFNSSNDSNNEPVNISNDENDETISMFSQFDYVPPAPGTGIDSTNVFVKYLPLELTNTGLFTLFSQFGEIKSCKVMVDPVSGKSLGFGYVWNKPSNLSYF